MIRPGKVLEIDNRNNLIICKCENGFLGITIYLPEIVHIAFYPGKGEDKLPMWGISAAPDLSVEIKTEFDSDNFIIRTNSIIVYINRYSSQITVVDCKGNRLLQTADYYLKPATISGEDTYNVYLELLAQEDECYYGLGQHQLGWMNHKGKEVFLWHDYKAKCGEIVAVPFMVTNRNYGFIFDNCSRTSVTPGMSGLTKWSAEVGEALSFFFVFGTNVDKIYQGYRHLTGITPIPPKSSLGYIQCKQRYKDRDELMKVAKTYREKGYPCDMLIIDWFHWKVLGDLDLDEAFWPDAKVMIDQLREMGYSVMISCWPRFMKESKNYSFLEEKGWFMKDENRETLYGTHEDQRGALIDTTNPECAGWYWNTIYENYAKKGFTSWWLDENEPDICPHSFYLHAGTGARIHNIYPLTHTKAVYEGHRKNMKERCLILSRAAYLGAQQYGTTFWSSDVYPTWDVLKRQIPTGLNFCATGMVYWSSDIGGWQELPNKENKDAGYKQLLLQTEDTSPYTGSLADYPELYTRWFQFGAFCPTFRAHGTRDENEVWSYGKEVEKILVKYLKLRYMLMPYIYSLAYDAYKTGRPFMRALFMDFPQDLKVSDIKDQYMFGPAFLVAPVVEQGAKQREVYLPVSAGWYDYWTNKKYDGGQTVIVDALIDTIPLFVRAGSIIPCAEIVPHTGIPQKEIELWVYKGQNGHFTLYNDDGKTYNYEDGDFITIDIEWIDERELIILDNTGKGFFPGHKEKWLKIVG